MLASWMPPPVLVSWTDCFAAVAWTSVAVIVPWVALTVVIYLVILVGGFVRNFIVFPHSKRKDAVPPAP